MLFINLDNESDFSPLIGDHHSLRPFTYLPGDEKVSKTVETSLNFEQHPVEN
jgi:hypothetical protein